MCINLYKRVAAVAVLVSLSTLIYGQELPSLRDLERAEKPELPGAKVSHGNDASRIAQKAYVEKVRSLSAYEGAGKANVVELGFDVKDFAKTGDKVWEVRLTTMNPDGRRALRAILWVHSETEQVHFVCGPWEEEKSE